MTVSKITSPPSQKELIDKTNEIIDNLGGGGATDVQINGTSITSGGVANIVTNTAYDASNNKIATMSDLPDNELFIATVYTTTFNEVLTAYNAGKTVYAKYNYSLYTEYYFLYRKSSNTFYFGSAGKQATGPAIYTFSLNQNSGWDSEIYELVRNTDSSIASSRFDGQWVRKYSNVASNTAINSYTHSLSTYLPNDSQAYEIFVRVGCNTLSGSSGGSGNFAVGTVTSPDTNNNSGYSISLRVTTNSTQARGAIILPIASNVRNFYSQITGHKMENTFIVLCGYRRIGTNT